MSPESFHAPHENLRLNEIETHLSKLFATGQPGHDEFLRYYGAAFRYFRSLVADEEAARDLTNQFAQRFYDEEFDQYDARKGRFRDFIKAAIRNMAIDGLRRKRTEPLADLDPAQPSSTPDDPFDSAWQQELLNKAWKALESRELEKGQPYYTILKIKAEQPKARSSELAATLSRILDRPIKQDAARQLVHRARDLFQDLVLDEVARSIGTSDQENLCDELDMLRLTAFCRPALRRRFGNG